MKTNKVIQKQKTDLVDLSLGNFMASFPQNFGQI